MFHFSRVRQEFLHSAVSFPILILFYVDMTHCASSSGKGDDVNTPAHANNSQSVTSSYREEYIQRHHDQSSAFVNIWCKCEKHILLCDALSIYTVSICQINQRQTSYFPTSQSELEKPLGLELKRLHGSTTKSQIEPFSKKDNPDDWEPSFFFQKWGKCWLNIKHIIIQGISG